MSAATPLNSRQPTVIYLGTASVENIDRFRYPVVADLPRLRSARTRHPTNYSWNTSYSMLVPADPWLFRAAVKTSFVLGCCNFYYHVLQLQICHGIPLSSLILVLKSMKNAALFLPRPRLGQPQICPSSSILVLTFSPMHVVGLLMKPVAVNALSSSFIQHFLNHFSKHFIYNN